MYPDKATTEQLAARIVGRIDEGLSVVAPPNPASLPVPQVISGLFLKIEWIQISYSSDHRVLQSLHVWICLSPQVQDEEVVVVNDAQWEVVEEAGEEVKVLEEINSSDKDR